MRSYPPGETDRSFCKRKIALSLPFLSPPRTHAITFHAAELTGHFHPYPRPVPPRCRANTDPVARQQLRKTLYVTLEVLRIAGILLQPVCPAVATELLDHVAGGTGAGERTVRGAEFGTLDGEALAIRKKPLISRCAVVAG